MALTLAVWPYVFVKPGPKFTDSDAVKVAYAEQSIAKVDLKDYPINHEVLGAIVYFTGPFTNTERIRVQFGARDDKTDRILWTGEQYVPTPASQGFEWWNWYQVKFWIGHADWEINGPMKVRMSVRVTEGTKVLYDKNIYQDVIDTSPLAKTIINFTTIPWGAQTTVDEIIEGETPISVSRDANSTHTVTFAMKEHKPMTLFETWPSLGSINKLYVLEKIPPPPPEKTWWEKALETINVIFYPFGYVIFEPLRLIYNEITGLNLTEDEWKAKSKQVVEWILPLNALSKLLTGKNLAGKTEEFGTGTDYIDLALGVAIFIPFGKLAGTGAKVLEKAGSKGLLEVSEKAIAKGASEATIKEFAGVLKLSDYIVVKEAEVVAAKTGWAASKIAKWDKLLKPFQSSPSLKLLKWGIVGIIGVDGMMAWLASDNVITGVTFTLNKLRDAAEARTITKEEAKRQLDLIQKWKDYATNFVKTSTILNPLLWAFRGILLINAEKGQLDIDLERKNIEAIVGIVKLPEIVKSKVRDIIDGDTIDVSLDMEGSLEKLPQYAKTGHARIRIIGINSPEKSPKGEIICTGIEVYKVEATYTDQARNVLLPLNEKVVTLYIDPEHTMDVHNRILAKVMYDNKDIGLEQIKRGLACYYFVEENKYQDKALYESETLKAKSAGIGMWKEVVEVEKGAILFSIDSIPSNAKVFIDGIATKHNTPTNEVEQKDVIALWTEGAHTLRLEKSGMIKEVPITLVRDERLELVVDLTALPPIEEIPPEEEKETFWDLERAKEMVRNKLGRIPAKIPTIKVEKAEELHYGFKILGTYNGLENLAKLSPNIGDATGTLAHELVHALIYELTKGVMTSVEIKANEIIAYAVNGTGTGYKRVANEVEAWKSNVMRLIIDEVVRTGKLMDSFTKIVGVDAVMVSEGILQMGWTMDKITGVPSEKVVPPVEVPPVERKILFTINSMPSNAKVWIDEVYTKHLTPTDEKEQKDVIKLWTEGKHKIRLMKGGYSAEKEITLVKGVRLTESLDLTGIAKPPVEKVPPIEVPVPKELPVTYTEDQKWVLREAFDKIWELTAGAAQMSEKEYRDLVVEFSMYSAEQRLVVNLLLDELYPYIKGAAQLSTDEFLYLKQKYRMA